MISAPRRFLTLAAISAIASAPVSQAAVSQDFSPKERAMAGLLLFLMTAKGYQPSYGFSQSPQDERVSILLSIVGGHLSVPNPSQTSGVTMTSGSTLTLTGNSGFSETLGPVRVTGSIGHGATTGSTLLLGSSSSMGTTWDSSTLTIWPWPSSSSSGSGLVSNQLSNLNVLTFTNPGANGEFYSATLVPISDLTVIPEPSALLLGGITGSLALLRRRRTA